MVAVATGLAATVVVAMVVVATTVVAMVAVEELYVSNPGVVVKSYVERHRRALPVNDRLAVVYGARVEANDGACRRMQLDKTHAHG